MCAWQEVYHGKRSKYKKSGSNRLWFCWFYVCVYIDAEQSFIYAGDYSDIADAAIIVITAGAAQKPGETRLDLVKKNTAIMKSIIGEIKKQNCQGILLIVSNPVDVLTNVALKASGFP